MNASRSFKPFMNPMIPEQYWKVLLFFSPLIVLLFTLSNQAMAAPAFETYSSQVAGSDTTSLTISVPGGTQENDLLLAAISTDGQETVTAPSGWILVRQRITNDGSANEDVALAVFYRVASNPEPADYTFSWTNNEQATGAILRYSGIDYSDPIDVHARNRGNSAQPRPRRVTTTVDDTMVVRFFGSDDDEAPFTTHADYTERVELESNTGNGTTTLGIADSVQVLAGNSLRRPFTISTNERWAGITVAINPAVSDFGITKSVGDNTPDEGDSIVYTLTATNSGPNNGTNVIATDNLPAGVTYVSDIASVGSYDDSSGIWTIGALANGSSATLNITVTVDEGLGQNIVTTNTATISGDQTDNVPGNSSDSDDITTSTCPANNIFNKSTVSSTTSDSNSDNNTDFICTEVRSPDFGDAPASYDTPVHGIEPAQSLYLGSSGDTPDTESSTPHSADAQGDDGGGNSPDDENSVSFRSPGSSHSIFADAIIYKATANEATFCGWLDIPSGGAVDGSFDMSDGSCMTVDASNCADLGGNEYRCTIQWSNIPTDQSYVSYARFRVSTDSLTISEASGLKTDGEVEDYRVQFDFTPSAVTIGDVELGSVPVPDFLSQIGVEQMDGTALYALLTKWAPDLAASVDVNDREGILAALTQYLDSDGDGQVAIVAWETLEERGTIGFYVERQSDGGSWITLNDEMLPGLITAPMGGEYMLADPQAVSGHLYRYQLIEQEAAGTQRRYGPFSLEIR